MVGRLASRSLVIVDDDGAPAPRYRLLDSIRAFALEAMADAGLTDRGLDAHAAWFAAAAASSTGGRAQRPPGRAPGLRPRRARQHRRRAGLERRARPAARARHRRTASAGPGSSSATAGARSGSWPRSTPRASRRRPRDRASALLLAALDRGVDGSTSEPARRHVAAAGELADGARRPRPAGALRLPPRLRRLAPRRLGARAGAHRPQPGALRRAGPALGPGRERAVRRPGRDLGRRRRARRRRRATRSSTGCAGVDDPWLHVRRDAMLGELARVEHRFDDAVAPPRPGGGDVGAARLPPDRGLPAHQPRPRAVPGRRLRRPAPPRWSAGSRRRRPPATCGWRRSGGSTSAASCARSAGPPRRGRRSRRRRRGTATPAAESRRRSATACSRRSTPRTACPARSSGSPPSSTPRGATATRRSRSSPSTRSPAWPRGGRRGRGRELGDAADRRMESASHFITERDRTDAPRRAGAARRRPAARHDDRDAGDLPVVDDLAQQQERPHDRERGLRHLGDPDRADLDRLLGEHEQALGRDPAREREDQHVRPAGARSSRSTSPWASASGSTATVAIGQIVAMKVVTSMSRRKCFVDAT